MGSCLSSESFDRSLHQKPSANVVSVAGELLRYPLPITVAQVIQSQTGSPPDSLFLCNSDRLYFDDYIPSLDLDEELEPAQIYFLLPTAKLQYRLAASDMAAMAVKASVAFEQINGSDRRWKRKNRISPVLMSSDEDPQSNRTFNPTKISGDFHGRGDRNNSTATAAAMGLGVSRSGSVRKLTKYSSRRAKLAVRSFKLKLNTIYEGSVLLLI